MGFFSKILGKLGIGKKDDGKPEIANTAKPASGAPATAAKPTSSSSSLNPAVSGAGNVARPATAKVDAAAAKPVAMEMVDVVSKLEGLAKANPAKLNWKTSIVDLLKLLDLESSLEARKELATELGCPANLMGDSAKINTWLHKEVLRKIAANGGNIPKDLLD